MHVYIFSPAKQTAGARRLHAPALHRYVQPSCRYGGAPAGEVNPALAAPLRCTYTSLLVRILKLLWNYCCEANGGAIYQHIHSITVTIIASPVVEDRGVLAPAFAAPRRLLKRLVVWSEEGQRLPGRRPRRRSQQVRDRRVGHLEARGQLGVVGISADGVPQVVMMR